ncbi:hypothetical protein HDU93_004715, partial [Gonapodya sp. JEL0774]
HSIADDVETGTHFSETVSQPESLISAKGLYTCISCQIGFVTPDAQRDHYKTDWHRYNLKRKVALLPAVSEDTFKQRMLAQQNKTREDVERAKFSAECVACNKTYYTHNAYQNHLQSNKHREAMALFEKKHGSHRQGTTSTTPRANTKPIEDTHRTRMDEISSDAGTTKSDSTTAESRIKGPTQHQIMEWRRRLADAKTEEEIEKIADEKIAASARLDPESDCLFCTTTSADLEANMDHMSSAHSFFVPDVDYLEDLKGLISYLGEKISIGNTCIYCDGKGRQLHSLEAVRKHMIDKGHTKVAYGVEEADEEISKFYVFSDEEKSEDDEDEDSEQDENRVTPEHGVDLVLPDGRRAGHRSLRVYYKQNFGGPLTSSSAEGRNAKNRLLIRKIAQQYRLLSSSTSPSSIGALVPVGMSGPHGALASLRTFEQIAKVARKERRAKMASQRQQRRQELMWGMQANSQKHYRPQVDF